MIANEDNDDLVYLDPDSNNGKENLLNLWYNFGATESPFTGTSLITWIIDQTGDDSSGVLFATKMLESKLIEPVEGSVDALFEIFDEYLVYRRNFRNGFLATSSDYEFSLIPEQICGWSVVERDLSVNL